MVLCGLLSPCKTLRNFLSPPTAEYGNPAVSGHFCNYRQSQLKGSLFHTTPFCSETFFVFENVSCVVECPTEPRSLLSLCRPAVLQLKLQQRRTREELVSQGIMPRKCLCLSAFHRAVFSTWRVCLVSRGKHLTESKGGRFHLSLSFLCFSKFKDFQSLIAKILPLLSSVKQQRWVEWCH